MLRERRERTRQLTPGASRLLPGHKGRTITPSSRPFLSRHILSLRPISHKQTLRPLLTVSYPSRTTTHENKHNSNSSGATSASYLLSYVLPSSDHSSTKSSLPSEHTTQSRSDSFAFHVSIPIHRFVGQPHASEFKVKKR